MHYLTVNINQANTRVDKTTAMDSFRVLGYLQSPVTFIPDIMLYREMEYLYGPYLINIKDETTNIGRVDLAYARFLNYVSAANIELYTPDFFWPEITNIRELLWTGIEEVVRKATADHCKQANKIVVILLNSHFVNNSGFLNREKEEFKVWINSKTKRCKLD